MPTKNASSDMNSADNPRNETTRLSALATGFRLRTTAAPNIKVSTAKIQNRNGDISFNFEFRISNFEFGRSLFLVPFQYHAVHYSADLEKFFLVMHHVAAREPGDGVIFAQKNRLLRTNFLAHPAVNAADHIDIEFLRKFFDLGETIRWRDLPRNNLNRARRTDEFAKLTSDTAHPSTSVPHQGGGTAVMIRQVAVPFLLGILHRHFGASEQHILEML